MYQPPAFREDRPEVLHALIRAHPLGTLVTGAPGGLVANLLPFLLIETEAGPVLRAHLARANTHVNILREADEALVIFQGPEAYVSPSWYASKAEHGKVVPTWNYAVVQVAGAPEVIDAPEWLAVQIAALTEAQEAGRAEPWAVADAPAPFVAAQIRGIVGLEIPVARIEGKWKMSQNRGEADRRGVARGLRESGDANGMADMVALPE
jgi:transcriptional regulator